MRPVAYFFGNLLKIFFDVILDVFSDIPFRSLVCRHFPLIGVYCRYGMLYLCTFCVQLPYKRYVILTICYSVKIFYPVVPTNQVLVGFTGLATIILSIGSISVAYKTFAYNTCRYLELS